MKNTTTLLALLISSVAFGQHLSKNALFIGNSYTYENNLAQMIVDAAASTGDTLTFDSYAMGGYSLASHLVSTITTTKIMAGNWDYVVLQEQSQLPALPTSQFMTGVFPFAHKLDSLINKSNPCGETVFYMTWGRKNGDAVYCSVYGSWPWPAVCTYEGMDSLLNLRYRMMADSNDAVVSPVGAVWNNIRSSHPQIELYQADESHPSVAGTYAAACCFYATFFRKDPTLITSNPGLPAADAAVIRNAAKLIVYDSLLNWHIGEYDAAIDAACSPVDTNEENQDLFWKIFPNPASGTLNIEFAGNNRLEQIQVYNAAGILMQDMEITSPWEINLANLPKGLYFIRLKNNQQSLRKFVKQ